MEMINMAGFFRYGILTLFLCTSLSSPSWADKVFVPEPQSPLQDSDVPQVDDAQERLQLSRELHDIKRVKESVLQNIDNVARSLPRHEQEDFKKYIELNVNFDDLEEKSIAIAAKTYTIAELKAMIAYFGSNEGRSAEAKGREYGEKFGIEMEREINKAIAAAKFDEVGGQPHSEPSMDMLGK
ncbi:MAG: hypothetical protein H6864_00900 [Micavibrio sp.]|jgi:hypothetical protein|nr:hypothetical protein [Micavibrio sp.]